MATGKRIKRAVGAKVLSPHAELQAPGETGVLSRLIEIVFLQAVRGQPQANGQQEGHGSAGFIAALQDPNVSKALKAIHNQPGTGWTIETLRTQACPGHALPTDSPGWSAYRPSTTWPNGGCSRDGPCLPKQTHPWKTLQSAAGTPRLLPFPDGSSRSSASAPVPTGKADNESAPIGRPAAPLCRPG